MDAGDIAQQRKKSAPLIKWAKAIIDGADVLSMAADFLAKLDELRAEKVVVAGEIRDLSEKKAALANEFHAQEASHANTRERFGPEISRLRAEVNTARAKAKVQLAGFADQLIAAQKNHASALSALAEEILELEGLLGTATEKYNAFKKEIISHG